MVVVITNIDRDPPTIVIDGPPSNISTNVTITGMVSNQETTSNSVSGLASFGYVVQVIDDACTTTENGVRLCFIAIDNAGNVRAVASSVYRESRYHLSTDRDYGSVYKPSRLWQRSQAALSVLRLYPLR